MSSAWSKGRPGDVVTLTIQRPGVQQPPLFMRLEDPSAWLLALLFAGFIAVSDLPSSFMALRGIVLPFMLGYRALFVGAITPLFYYFLRYFRHDLPSTVIFRG